MNQEQLMKKKNDSARLLEHSSRIHRNCVRLNCGSTIRHEMAKAEACYWLKKAGLEFVCEAVFKNGGDRADIFVLDHCVAIEIVESESEASIEKKRKKYPCRIVTLTAGQELKEELLC